MLGLGGGAEVSVGDEQKDPSDMLATYGFSLGFEAPVHPYITLGAFVQFAQWNVQALDEEGSGRSTLWDLAVFPKLRYPIVNGDQLVELYAGPVIGASNNSLSDDIKLESGTEHSTFGLTVGAFAGLAYFVSPSVGLSFEIGYQHRSYSFSGEDALELSFGQLGVNAGVLVAL
jgi:hypothetical protein